MRLMHRFGIYSVIGVITLMSLLVLPAMVGLLVDDSALTESQAGWAASINFFGGALIALVMAFRMHHLHLRRVAMLGFALAAMSDFAAAFYLDQPAFFMTIRFLSGLGSGAAYTAVLASFARLPDMDRGYGMFVTLQFIISGFGLYLLPVYSGLLGTFGLFMGLAVLEVLGLALAVYLPGRPAGDVRRERSRTEIQVLLAAATITGTLGFALFEAGYTAQFTYVERLAVALSFSDQQVGVALMIASLAGIPGAFCIILMGNRFGRIGPLTVGIAIALAGIFLLIASEQFMPYLLATSMISFSWAFCLPFIQGLMASLDPHGSAVAAASASSTVGGAIGPGLAAVVVVSGSYDMVFLFAGALLTAALLSFFYSSRHASA
jgi:predicted MFS family arabinose efflux permease